MSVGGSCLFDVEHTLLDPSLADVRLEFAIAEAEIAQAAERRSAAALIAALGTALREARETPSLTIGPANYARRDAVELAERAVIADLAVRLALAESTVRSYAHLGESLRERMPQVWRAFREGDISLHNALECASIVLDLPAEFWSRFDAEVSESARRLAPARFRASARGLRDRLTRATAEKRHESAVVARRVWSEHDRDGMSWFGAYLPAETVALANARIDAAAFDLLKLPTETRTMAQLRADVLTDLLLGSGTSTRVGVAVALTIPMLTLLGHGDDPAILEGVGPIDLATARRLAGDAPSITRLLTDPVTGAVRLMDPNQYRNNRAMRRWFTATHATCDFPGCGRRAANCDLDHTTAWVDYGRSTIPNLAPRCRKHHSMKHETKWKVERPPGSTRPVWTSPTGHARESDPPPF
jgi:hypothetical protein